MKLDEVFGETARQIQDAITSSQVRAERGRSDACRGPWRTSAQQIDESSAVLKEKAVAAQKRRNETAVRQIEKAVNGLLPEASSRNGRSTSSTT